MNLSKRELWGIVLLVCISITTSAWLLRPRSNFPPGNQVVPVVVPRQPNPAFSNVTFALRSASAAQKRQLAQAWSDLAWVLERDSAVKSSGQLRTLFARFEELLFAKTSLAGAFPGFSSAANAGLLQMLGTEDKPLERAIAVAAVRDLAFACDPSFQEDSP